MAFYIERPIEGKTKKREYVTGRKHNANDSYQYLWSSTFKHAKAFYNRSNAQEWRDDIEDLTVKVVELSTTENPVNGARGRRRKSLSPDLMEHLKQLQSEKA